MCLGVGLIWKYVGRYCTYYAICEMVCEKNLECLDLELWIQTLKSLIFLW